MLGEQRRAIKIKAAQEPALSAPGNAVSIITVFRVGTKRLLNFIRDNASSFTSTLFNTRAAFEVEQMCLLFHNL